MTAITAQAIPPDVCEPGAPDQATYVSVLNAIIDKLGRTEAAERMTAAAALLYPGQGRVYYRQMLANWQRRGVPERETRPLHAVARSIGIDWPPHLEVLIPPGSQL